MVCLLRKESPMVLAFAGTRPTWSPKPSVASICLSERVKSDSPAAMPLKEQLTSAATPWSWDAYSLRPGNLPSLLERIPERPLASALLDELKALVKDVVDASWRTLVAGEDPKEGEIGTLLNDVDANGRERRRDRGRGRWGKVRMERGDEGQRK